MSWREDLRRVVIDGKNLVGASFRGVPFFVESSERSGGRRTVVHEFPFRDDPFVEDLGKHAGTFPIEGYVIGDDYMAKRDALRAALEDVAGTGELVHPYHGVLRAICSGMRIHEAKDIGGIAKFSLEFQETPTQAPVPTEVVDAADQVDDGADAATTATSAELVEQFDATGLPSFALGSAETALTNALSGLQDKLAPAITTTQELAALTGNIALMTAEASSLVRTPAAMISQFHAAITALVDTAAAAPGAVMDALFDAYAIDLGEPVVDTTATRARELANQTALTGALRRVIAIEAARLAPLVTYVSIDEALAARDKVSAMLEEQAGTAGDTAYPALVDLRSQVLRAVPGGQAFASVVTVTRKVPVPSLLLAYQLYGSVKLEADILARNGVVHPGFVVGDLKVLSDDV